MSHTCWILSNKEYPNGQSSLGHLFRPGVGSIPCKPTYIVDIDNITIQLTKVQCVFIDSCIFYSQTGYRTAVQNAFRPSLTCLKTI